MTRRRTHTPEEHTMTTLDTSRPPTQAGDFEARV